jgi:SHS family sialic acid transporter-like MFS transporter
VSASISSPAKPPIEGAPIRSLSSFGRYHVLASAFIAWMIAGVGIAQSILIHRQMMLDLAGPSTPEETIKRMFAFNQAAFLLGAAAGGWCFGWLGDRYGRTRAMGLSLLCYSVFTFASYFAPDVETIILLRFLACLGIGGVWPSAVALVAEAWPDASRPFLAGLLGGAANFGQVFMGACGYFVAVTPDNWRMGLLVGAGLSLFGLWVIFFTPESVKWLEARRGEAKAAKPAAPMRDVLMPPLLYRTILGVSLGAVAVVGTAVNGNWVVPWRDQVADQDRKAAIERGEKPKPGDGPKSKAITQMTRSAGGIFGSLLGGILASFLGRRLSYFLISIASLAASTFVFTQLDPSMPSFQFWTFVFGFVTIIYFGWLPLFLPELFPTSVRATGTGISFNSGRIVAAVVALVVAFYNFGGSYSLLGFWTGMIYAVGAAIIWFAPKEAQRELTAK